MLRVFPNLEKMPQRSDGDMAYLDCAYLTTARESSIVLSCLVTSANPPFFKKKSTLLATTTEIPRKQRTTEREGTRNAITARILRWL